MITFRDDERLGQSGLRRTLAGIQIPSMLRTWRPHVATATIDQAVKNSSYDTHTHTHTPVDLYTCAAAAVRGHGATVHIGTVSDGCIPIVL